MSSPRRTRGRWRLSAAGRAKGANKREVWERLLAERKLGALALLRNLRNMEEAG